MYQDQVILKYVETHNVARRREQKNKKNLITKSGLLRTTKYYIRNRKSEKIPVCMETFLNVLNISRFRVNRITKAFHTSGFLSENRGGFRKGEEYKPMRENVMNFINKLQCVESHYCRGQSIKKYLPSHLNITKLWKCYQSEPGNKIVKLSYFRDIFNSQYNLSFQTPRTDVCSTCLSLNEKIKFAKDEKKKEELQNEKGVHRLRYKAFYERLKDTDLELLILSYDCQKNLPLPKVPDQKTYYSRQVYVQNFTIVQGHSKSPLDPSKNVTSYCWTENEYSRDSNTISSCIFHHLNSLDMSAFKKIRLISDGCAGQNKNSSVVAMCHTWLSSRKAPKHINEIEIVFPITGHSYLPADRVFGKIENDMKRLESVTNPETVYELISRHAMVKYVGKDCEVANFRSTAQSSLKNASKWHFQISKAKRIFIKRPTGNKILVRGEISYNFDYGVYKSLLKPKTKFNTFSLNSDIVKKKNQLPAQKLKDVESLLTAHFGPEWIAMPDLQFYINLRSCSSVSEQEVTDDLCEPLLDENEPDIIV